MTRPTGCPGQLAESGFKALQKAQRMGAELTSRSLMLQRVGTMAEKLFLLDPHLVETFNQWGPSVWVINLIFKIS